MRTVKTYLLLLSLFFVGTSYGQMTKQAVYQEYQLSTTDHRGVEIVEPNPGCTQSFPSIEKAIEHVFTMTQMTDYVRVCVNMTANNHFNKPMSIDELVELYVELHN